jgi:hypothetical protein
LTRTALLVLLLAGCAKSEHSAHPVPLESHHVAADGGAMASAPPPDAGVLDADDDDWRIATGWLPDRAVTDPAHIEDLLCADDGVIRLDVRPDPDAAIMEWQSRVCIKGACQDLPSGGVASADGKLLVFENDSTPRIVRFPEMKKISDPRCPGCAGKEDDYGCGVGFFLGDDIFLGAGRTCDEYPAQPFLAHVKTGKPIAIVGGKVEAGKLWDSDPRTFRFVRLAGDVWAISGGLASAGRVVVVQDVRSGHVLRRLRMHANDAPDGGPKGGIAVLDESNRNIFLQLPPCDPRSRP